MFEMMDSRLKEDCDTRHTPRVRHIAAEDAGAQAAEEAPVERGKPKNVRLHPPAGERAHRRRMRCQQRQFTLLRALLG